MPLFLVQHRHSPDRCPAADPQMGPKLLSHLSPQNAEHFGITIRGDAVIDGKHTLVLILEASNTESVDRFMQPFSQAGGVEVFPASRCEVVVHRGAC